MPKNKQDHVEYNKKWRARNRRKIKKYNKKAYLKNRTKLLNAAKNHRRDNPNRPRSINSPTYLNSPEGWAKYKAKALKYSAKNRGLEYNLNWTDLFDLVVDTCPISGIKLNYGLLKTGSKIAPDHVSVDRIDNSKGYIKGNIIIVSNLVNRIKSNLSLDDLDLLYKIADYYKQLK